MCKCVCVHRGLSNAASTTETVGTPLVVDGLHPVGRYEEGRQDGPGDLVHSRKFDTPSVAGTGKAHKQRVVPVSKRADGIEDDEDQ